MGVLTIKVDEKVEKEFREEAVKKFGAKKGYLGSAVEDAMKLWLKQKGQDEIKKQALARMEKGFDMGKILYKRREELWERH
ncbi:TPA: hypothetical protein H1012_02400 [archaeon]|nr:hypothetical protein [Candidatus Naiadarchaeales archaeon SRR2090153.bin461]HIK02674.1 hypothetical protein [Candidatus Naiadarchaeales archaeon SRR2090159.bin1288]